jgi:hypothetical protein
MFYDSYARQARAKITERRRRMRLPNAARPVFQNSLHKLKTHVFGYDSPTRAFALSQCSFTDEVKNYNNRQDSLGLTGPQPKLKNSITKDDAETLALKMAMDSLALLPILCAACSTAWHTRRCDAPPG